MYKKAFELSYKNKKVEIEIQDFVGDVRNINGTEDLFSLSYISDSKDKGQSILVTEADINFYADDYFNIDELKTVGETDIKVKYYEDDNLHWSGFVIPDFFSTSVDTAPVVSMVATDRIGTLKEISNNAESNIPIQILASCLKQTGQDLPINLIADNNHFETPVQLERIEDIASYDVIRTFMVLFNCKITLYKNAWWVINKKLLESGFVNYKSYNSNGVGGSVTPFAQPILDIDLVDRDGQREIKPTASEISLFLEFGGSKKYPNNWNFEKWNGTTFDNWTNYNGFSQGKRQTEIIFYTRIDGYYQAYLSEIETENKSLWYVARWYSNKLSDNILDYPNLKSSSVNVPKERGFIDIALNGNFTTRDGMPIWIVPLIHNKTNGNYFTYNKEGVILKIGSGTPNLNQSNFDYVHNPRASSQNGFNPDDMTHASVDVNWDIKNTFDLRDFGSDSDEIEMQVVFLGGIYSQGALDYGTDVFLNAVNISFNDSQVTGKGLIFKTKQGGEKFSKSRETETILFSDKINQGVNGYFYNYKYDDTSIVDLPSEFALSSVRERADMFSKARDYYSLDGNFIVNPLAKYVCGLKSFVLVGGENRREDASIIVEEIVSNTLNRTDFIYTYFDDGKDKVKSIGTASGGSSSSGGGGSSSGGGGGSSPSVPQLIKEDEEGNYYSEQPFYSLGGLSAFGFSEVGDGNGGGGIINVIDNLTSTSKTDPLSANQGRYLKTLIDNIEVGEGGQVIVDWEAITGKPTTFVPSAHTHIIGDVTGLQGELDGKASLSQLDDKEDKFTKNSAFNKSFGTGLNDVARGNHTHAFASLTSIPTTLAGYGITDGASKVHTHAISDVTNLQATLNNKLETSVFNTHKGNSNTEKHVTQADLDVLGLLSIVDGNLRIDATAYSTGNLSAFGLEEEGGGSGGGAMNMMQAWTFTTATENYYLPAKLAVPFYDDTRDRLSTLEAGTAPASHTHPISDISNLQTTLNGKLETSIFNTHNTDNVRHITGVERAKWNTVVNDFAGLEIGGRNYISSKYRKLEIRENRYVTVPFETGVSGQLTLSFNRTVIQGGAASSFLIFKNDAGATIITGYITGTGSTYFTFKVEELISEVFIYSGNSWGSSEGVYMDIDDLQLEKGNKATDWTPAPEDQVSDWSETNVNSFAFLKNKPTSLSQFTDNIGVATHIADKANPHSVTKAQVGLSNVDNAKQATKVEFDLFKSAYDEMFRKVGTSIEAKLPLYSLGGLSAYGFSEEGSETGGGIVNILPSWANYTSDKSGWALGAGLGKGLYDNKADKTDQRFTDARTPLAHTHVISDITGLQGALNSKTNQTFSDGLNTRLTSIEGGSATTINVSGTGDLLASVSKVGNNINFIKGNQSWGNLTGKPSTFAPSAHSHPISDITNLQTELNKKATNTALTTHVNKTDNPHSVTKSQVGLGNVANKDLSNVDNIQQATKTEFTSHKNLFDSMFRKVGTNIEAKLSLYSLGGLSAYGFSEEGSETGGGIVNILPSWESYTSDKSGWALSAGLGKGLYDNKADKTDPRFTDARTPLAHTHIISDVTGLQSALNAKTNQTFSDGLNTRLTSIEGGSATTVNVSGTGDLLASVSKVGNNINFIKGNQSWNNLTGKPTTFAPSAHTHPISDITNLQTTLDGKLETSIFNTHNNDNVKHITGAERTKWNTASGVGDFRDYGLGITTGQPPIITDLDDVTTPIGFYSYYRPTGTRPPRTITGGTILIEAYRLGVVPYIKQTITYNADSGGHMYYRTYHGANSQWSAWKEIYHSDNLTKSTLGLSNVDNIQQATKTEFTSHKNLFDSMFRKVGANIEAKLSLYSLGGLSAYGFSEEGSEGGGGIVNILPSWANYTTDKSGWALSAGLGVDLNTRKADKTWVESLLEDYVPTDTTYTAGRGLTLTGTQFSTSFDIANYATVTALGGKVDKVAGKSLISDVEITRLAGVTNQTRASLNITNVDNTSDANKPISSATQTALNSKLATSIFNTHNTDNIRHITGVERTKWDGVVTDFDNLEIGGRNLVLDSVKTIKSLGISRITLNLTDGGLKEGTYTISFNYDILIDNNDSLINRFLLYSTGSIGSVSKEIGTQGRASLTFNVTPERVHPVLYIYGGRSASKGNNTDIIFTNIKLEKGNKATDWTPAPEDQVSDWATTDVNSFSFIKNKPTQLSQFTDNIGVATHIADKANPHSVTKAQVGLSNVDNAKQATKVEFDLFKSAYDEMFRKVGTSIEAKLPLYSLGGLSAYGFSDEGSSSGGGIVNILPSWESYDTSKSGWALSAGLGENLRTRVVTLENAEIDLSGYATLNYVNDKVKTDVPLNAKFTDTIVDISGKVDKKSGFSLVADTEITRLSSVTNQDLSSYAKTSDVNTLLLNKVDKVTGKSLISDTEITRLSSVTNQDLTPYALKIYVDTEVGKKWTYNETTIKAVKVSNAVRADNVGGFTVGVNVPANAKFTDTIVDISGKVDKVSGKGLSTNDFTTVEKNKLAILENQTRESLGVDNVTNESKATMFTNPTFTGTTKVTILELDSNWKFVKVGDNIELQFDGVTKQIMTDNGDIVATAGVTAYQ